ncbi:MAG: protease modulator HflC [Phycisphaerae bacterium]|nr:protease modulator HflC [Phycisphaerae bacterium]
MKNLAVTILVAVVMIILALYLFSFQVRETEFALVTTFGKPTRPVIEPGWHFKWPSPIENKIQFDSRMRNFEMSLDETTTKGAVPIIVNTYVIWRVADPLKFYTAVGTVKEAENKLHSLAKDTQNRVIGRHNFSEFVNSDPAKIRFTEIQDEMLADLQRNVSDDFGIAIETLGIKQLKVSSDVSKEVFARMQAERMRKTNATIAEGEAQAMKIRTEADAQKTELLAAADARAKSIMGQGDAEAAQYYKMLEADTQLAMFLRDIEALKKILAQRSTIVISADTQPFKLLKEMPELGKKTNP